jgi:Tol biopolymer transport system component
MYWAKRAGKWVVVTNDAESAEYDGVHAWLFHFVFSPDGHRVAYFPIRGNQELLVLDGREIVHSRGLINPVWSPDSSKLAYIVQGAVTRVGVNGVEENEAWDRVDSISFSPDSRRLAYVGTRAGRQHLVVDKQTGPPVDGIDVTSVRFKPDSSGLIYVEKRGGRVVVVDGGKASAAYDEITELTVSPDSRQIAFFGRAASSWYFVRDGVVSAPYDARYDAVRAESLQFSKDSKHFWYVIRQAGTDSVVVNDMSVPSYSEVLTMPTLVEKRLRYLGVRSGVIYYVEVALDVQGRPTR